MAISFKCRYCGHTLLTEFLKPGEPAFCRECGNSTLVPGDAAFSSAPVEEAVESSSAKRTPEQCEAELDAQGIGPDAQLYSKSAIVWCSAALSIFAGGYLLACNWRTLHRPDIARRVLMLTTSVLIAIVTLAVVTDDGDSTFRGFGLLHAVLAYTIGWFVTAKQGNVLRLYHGAGRIWAPVWRPMVIVIPSLIAIVFGVSVPLSYWIDSQNEERIQARVDHAADLCEAGMYDSSLVVIRSLRHTLDGQARYPAMLGTVYLGRGQGDSAVLYLSQAVKRDSLDGKFRNMYGAALAMTDRTLEGWQQFQIAKTLGDTIDPAIEEAVMMNGFAQDLGIPK